MLFVAVLVLSLPLSWFAVKLKEAEQRYEAIQTIEEAGCTVVCEITDPAPPDWMRAAFGDKLYTVVPTVGTIFDKLDKFGDRHAGYLTQFHELETLRLNGSDVSDAGAEYLGKLTNLTELQLANTQVSDQGLFHLKSLGALTWLDLGGTEVTGAGIEQLHGLTELRVLDLSGTQITDAQLGTLQQFPKRWWLLLDGTQISDAGVEHLAALHSLGKLNLLDTQVTPSGGAILREALPMCEIEAGPSFKQYDDIRKWNFLD